MNPQTTIAIIPARGGSVRLPRKNMRVLDGKPLVAHAILQAQGATLVQRVIVSTEDAEIEQVAREYGAEVIKRPVDLAQGEAGSVLRVIQHVLAYLEKYEAVKPLVVVLVQPTSPLRTSDDIDNTIQLMLDSGTASAVSMCNGKENGAVYVSRRFVFDQGKVTADVHESYLMPPERSIDIDTKEDLEQAETIIRGGQDDNRGVLHKLGKYRRSKGNDKGGKGKRGRPSKVSTL